MNCVRSLVILPFKKKVLTITDDSRMSL
uniref:Uncharacterized protein n=1 Tax=Anguilla anguilla TaxID=7936 RepID=A0A0E9UEH4_ANGAN